MNLRAKLERLASRGNPRSTSDVWKAATAGGPTHPARSRLLPARPAGAFAAGFAAVAVVAVVSVVVFNLGSGGQPVGSDLETTSSSTSTTKPEPEPATLSVEFTNWVFPLSEDEYQKGAELYQQPFYSFSGVATCLGSFGFQDYADALLADSLPKSGLGLSIFWMPRRAVRNVVGSDSESYPVMVLLTLVVPSSEGADRDFWVAAIQRNVEQRPWLGVTVDQAGAFYDAGIECLDGRPSGIEYPAGTPFEAARPLQGEWLFDALSDVDQDPAVASAIDGVLSCLAADDGGFFQAAEDPERAVGLFDYFGSAALDDDMIEEMYRLYDLYYDCMQPVVEARHPLRVAARDRLVEENQTRLLKMQADIQLALDELDG